MTFILNNTDVLHEYLRERFEQSVYRSNSHEIPKIKAEQRYLLYLTILLFFKPTIKIKRRSV